ncbi:MAG TPA: plastocyanin/azurin family copper-binding protein [Candidatus Dormibacteraeota bacterium]|jgi:plastocyanin|nr:plastocyanin/azurin family copper-binding protein [Candidatus Dormibacteraeota bacterium]
MTRTRSVVTLAGLGLVVSLCACGNGPPEVAGGAGSAPSVGTAGPSLGQPGSKVVANSSLQFAPGNVTVSVGEIIQWTVAQDSVPHNVTFDSDSTLNSAPTLGPGEVWQVKFTTPGTYAYHCTIHSGMNGQVTVTSGAAAASSPAGGSSAVPTVASSP